MKQLLLLFILVVGTEFTIAQNSITDAEALLLSASEGDLYQATPSGAIYIGLASGAYQAFDTNMYKTDGTLSNSRNVNGGNFDLHFSSINNFRINTTKSLLYATNNTQINTTAGFTQLWGSSGIILYDATTFESSIWTKAGIKDTSGDFGTAGQILSSTATGTNWIDNTNTIQFFTEESASQQDWAQGSEQTVASHEITITQECLIDIDYVFSYLRIKPGVGNPQDTGGYREIHVDITGTSVKNNQMSSLANTYGTSEGWATCTASRKYKFPAGTYTFTMTAYGDHQCRTQAQNSASYGWSFDITATPLNI